MFFWFLFTLPCRSICFCIVHVDIIIKFYLYEIIINIFLKCALYVDDNGVSDNRLREFIEFDNLFQHFCDFKIFTDKHLSLSLPSVKWNNWISWIHMRTYLSMFTVVVNWYWLIYKKWSEISFTLRCIMNPMAHQFVSCSFT